MIIKWIQKRSLTLTNYMGQRYKKINIRNKIILKMNNLNIYYPNNLIRKIKLFLQIRKKSKILKDLS